MPEPPEKVRIDLWLWAARFFKSRSLAKAAVQGGKVHLDGERVKPSHGVREGSVITITRLNNIDNCYKIHLICSFLTI